MDKLVFSCFLLGGLTSDPGPTDFCALNTYCTAGVTNVGCNPPAITGGSACDGLNPAVIELRAAEQSYILHSFNSIRNEHGSGANGNDPANRLFVLQWDTNLATQAGHNARSCIIARDTCRNTADFRNVGQLLAPYTSAANLIARMTIARKIQVLLYPNTNFNAYYNGNALFSSYSASTNTENQANLMNDRATKVGCALMQWNNDGSTTLYMVCNFSANVIEGQPIYASAAAPGMGCATRDRMYPTLCLT